MRGDEGERFMLIETHGKASVSRNGRKAQVTIVIGAGSTRRSVTRHIEYRPGRGWFGLNPDPRAVELNDHYEAEFTEAQSAVSKLKAKLTALIVEQEQAYVAETMDDKKIDGLAIAIKNVEVAIHLAIADLNDADVKLRIVQRELPREVQFTGAGL